MDKKQALSRIMAQCAKEEMCLSKAEEKLRKWGAEGIDEILQTLVKEKFIDQERFTLAFVRDRTRFYGWGPRKIEFALKQLDIDKELIDRALEKERDSSVMTLKTLLERKKQQIIPIASRKEAKLLTYKEKQKQRAKLIRSALSKGFDYEAIMKLL